MSARYPAPDGGICTKCGTPYVWSRGAWHCPTAEAEADAYRAAVAAEKRAKKAAVDQ